jgi:hypothetical protein
MKNKLQNAETTAVNCGNEPMKLESGLILPGIEFTKTSLLVTRKITEKEWQDIGAKLCRAGGALRWWIGDWLRYGEHEWGEEYSKLPAAMEYRQATLRDLNWVAGSVDPSRRRDKLSWEHHREVAHLEPEEQDRWLNEAEKHKLTRAALRRSIKRGKVIYNWELKDYGTPTRLKVEDIDGGVDKVSGAVVIRRFTDKLPTYWDLEGCKDTVLLHGWAEALRPLVELHRKAGECERRELSAATPTEADVRDATPLSTLETEVNMIETTVKRIADLVAKGAPLSKKVRRTLNSLVDFISRHLLDEKQGVESIRKNN